MSALEGQVAFITGGASGLGLAIVDRFIHEGAKVVILDKNQSALDSLKSTYGNFVEAVCGDVRSYQDNKRAVSVAEDKFGHLDVFIGNAGIWDYGLALADIPEDLIDSAFDEVFGINTKGYLLGAKAALPSLVRAGGSVILTLSNAAFYTGGGGPLYTATKHANLGLVKQLAYEFAPYVRVNGVAPGAIPSDLRGAKSLGQDEMSLKQVPLAEYVKGALPLARMPSSEEYAGSYVYLASSENSGFATGAVINIDGGIGVRGLSSIAGGHALLNRYQNK